VALAAVRRALAAVVPVDAEFSFGSLFDPVMKTALPFRAPANTLPTTVSAEGPMALPPSAHSPG
jgi:hypothetical protein